MPKGCFIMIDGIDGSGKDTVANFWKERLASEGNGIFDLREYWKKNGTYPSLEEMRAYDFIFTSEPTYVGVGKVIREELTRNGTSYPEEAIAQAFSLDRLIHYHKVIIPALLDGKCIIQVRGVSTSLCYQSISGHFNLQFLSSLPGNALALKHRPDHLVIMDVEPSVTLQRISNRLDKNDDTIFEKTDFLEKATAMFHNEAYTNLFTNNGSEVHYLPAAAGIDTMKTRSFELLATLLS